MELGTLFDKIMDYRFIAVGLAIVAILHFLKKFVLKVRPTFYEGDVFKTILGVLPLGLGVIAAIPKGILSGDTFTQRVIFGIIAAYFSEKVIYELLLKRLTSLGVEVPAGVIPNATERAALDAKIESTPVEAAKVEEKPVVVNSAMEEIKVEEKPVVVNSAMEEVKKEDTPV